MIKQATERGFVTHEQLNAVTTGSGCSAFR
jgi:hypothetical protein